MKRNRKNGHHDNNFNVLCNDQIILVYEKKIINIVY